jgi:hypothetical protein
MVEFRYVHFEHPEARRLADLNGVSYDLGLVSSLCDHYLSIDHCASSDNLLLAQALFMSAVVTYGRTFGSAVRSGVKRNQIDLLSEDLQLRHQYFKDLRDKFVAHSVNAFEENCVKLYLQPVERGGPGVSSIGLGHARVATLSYENIEQLKGLAAEVLALVENEMEVERARLLEFSKTLPLEEIYQYPGPRAFYGDAVPSQVRRKIGEE